MVNVTIQKCITRIFTLSLTASNRHKFLKFNRTKVDRGHIVRLPQTPFDGKCQYTYVARLFSEALTVSDNPKNKYCHLRVGKGTEVQFSK